MLLRPFALLLPLALAAAPSPARAEPPPPAAAPAAPTWPLAGAPLAAPQVAFPKGMKRLRVYLDAGHGAERNSGNTSCTCEAEQDFTLRISQDLARRLEATGRFEVRLSRGAKKPVAYPDRVKEAEDWGTDVFLSIHSDARGQAVLAMAADARLCPKREGAPGFSVLWSDEGGATLLQQRHALARLLSQKLLAAGFPAYDGADYTGLYDGDTQPGVFVDRRPSSKRVFVLRKPTMPSVIIETHHAFDPEEVARWREPRTAEVFAASVSSALAGLWSGVSNATPAPDIIKSALTK
jgi:N-acetylmuramoyl-L-alanine amidase